MTTAGTTTASEGRSDADWMDVALAMAREAARSGEVPVGAVVVHDGVELARGCNRREATQDPIAHAEVLAIREAARRLGSWRLEGCTLYVTLEPCPMCAGALVNARVARLVYGAADPKAGAVDTLFALLTDERLNHRVAVTGGVQSDECSRILSEFFRALRAQGKH